MLYNLFLNQGADAFPCNTQTSQEDGWIVAECLTLPGLVSQGKDEALANIKEAITAWFWAKDQKAIADWWQSVTTFIAALCERELLAV